MACHMDIQHIVEGVHWHQMRKSRRYHMDWTTKASTYVRAAHLGCTRLLTDVNDTCDPTHRLRGSRHLLYHVLRGPKMGLLQCLVPHAAQ